MLKRIQNHMWSIIYKISTAFTDITTDYLIFGRKESLNNQINEPRELFSVPNEEISEDSVKDSNNKLKSIVLIYENNKFEQIDKL